MALPMDDALSRSSSLRAILAMTLCCGACGSTGDDGSPVPTTDTQSTTTAEGSGDSDVSSSAATDGSEGVESTDDGGNEGPPATPGPDGEYGECLDDQGEPDGGACILGACASNQTAGSVCVPDCDEDSPCPQLEGYETFCEGFKCWVSCNPMCPRGMHCTNVGTGIQCMWPPPE